MNSLVTNAGSHATEPARNRPRNGRERVIKLLSHREHIIAGVFARFQFFELRHRDR